MRMRSTGFVILSLMLHGLAVAAIALSPRQISEYTQGAEVEVKIGEPDQTPGVADAEKPSEAPPATKAEEPVAEAKPVEKPVEKVAEQPKPKKVAAVVPSKPKAAKPVKAAAAKPQPAPTEEAAKDETAELPPKQDPPEKLDPQVEDVPVSASSDAQAEEKPDFKPVKEKVSGVEAASDQETEAASQDVKQTADPTPAGVSEDTPAAAASATLGKGGATQAGAVEYTDLKQMNGNKPPVYPMAARMEKRQGQVELLYRVTKEGRVADVSVAQSSGSADLDSEAVRAVSKFRFVPGQEGWAKHPVQFNLKGDTAAMPSRLRTKVGSQE